MKTYKTIIVEDDEYSADALNLLIKLNLPELLIVGVAGDLETAIKMIEEHEPELVFLDIDLPDGDGFEIVNKTKDIKYKIVVTTAHEKYAVKAFDFEALHFISKPFNEDKLIEAFRRFKIHSERNKLEEKIEGLTLSIKSKNGKIMLTNNTIATFYDIDDIIYCQADAHYSKIYFKSGITEFIAKPIGELNKELQNNQMVRVHNSFIINLNHIKRYSMGRSARIIMSNEKELPIGISYREEFERKITEFINGG